MRSLNQIREDERDQIAKHKRDQQNKKKRLVEKNIQRQILEQSERKDETTNTIPRKRSFRPLGTGTNLRANCQIVWPSPRNREQ